jgi:hypothetical protein
MSIHRKADMCSSLGVSLFIAMKGLNPCMDSNIFKLVITLNKISVMNQIDRLDRKEELDLIGISTIESLMEDVRIASTIVSILEPEKFSDVLLPVIDPLKAIAELYSNPFIQHLVDAMTRYCRTRISLV